MSSMRSRRRWRRQDVVQWRSAYLLPRLTRPMRRDLHAAIRALAQVPGRWPIQIRRLTAQGGDMAIVGLPDGISVQVSLGDLMLVAASDGEVFAPLLSLGVLPRKVRGGWACADPQCRGHQVFPDLRSLLLDHWRGGLMSWLSRVPEQPVLLLEGGLEKGFGFSSARLVSGPASAPCPGRAQAGPAGFAFRIH